MTLDELAKKAGYSKSRFSHVFLEIVGMSPIKYHNDMRLKTSCELLHSTNLTIAEIARSCGFRAPCILVEFLNKSIKPLLHSIGYLFKENLSIRCENRLNILFYT